MRLQLCVIAAGAALVVAGCGSSNSTLSYSDFSSQASAICKQGNDAVRALKAQDPKTIGTTIEPFVQKIKDLKAPSELKSAQDQFVALSDQQVAALKAGDGAKANSLNGASDAAANKMGAKECLTSAHQ